MILMAHLRMTGHIHFTTPEEEPDRHLRVRLPLNDGTDYDSRT